MRQCESDNSNYRDFAGFTGEHLQSSSFINKEENCDKTKCFKNRHVSPTRGLEDMHIKDQNMQMNMSARQTSDLHYATLMTVGFIPYVYLHFLYIFPSDVLYL
jgi:hypothetical protein